MLHFYNREQAAAILIGLLLVLTLVEMWLSYREDRKYYEKRDTLTNIYLTSLAFIINLSVKAATFFILDYAWRYRFFEIKNTWIYWIALIIVQDFLYWVLHYVGHYSCV